MKYTFGMGRINLLLQIRFQLNNHSSCGSNSSQVWSKELSSIWIFPNGAINGMLRKSPLSNIKGIIYSDICSWKAVARNRLSLYRDFN